MDNYITIRQASENWRISPRRIQILCKEGRIIGAQKFGRSWAIPQTAKKPNDARVTTGEYRNWRKFSPEPIRTESIRKESIRKEPIRTEPIQTDTFRTNRSETYIR